MSADDLRVMVIDDSVIARKLLTDALTGVPGIELVATAPNGRLALQKIDQTPPDVVVVDLEMPEMDGIELVGILRERHPKVRVLIHTANGPMAQARAVEALTLGANDILLKPQLPQASLEVQARAVRDRLVPKILQFHRPARPGGGSGPLRQLAVPRPEALLIGISTGGPEALTRLLPALPASFPLPVVIVQHMPAGFTRALAERLDRLSPLTVREAAGGEAVHPGGVWIAPGGRHLEVRREGEAVRLALTDAPPENSCRPSADVLLRSAAAAWGRQALALVMTGMGSDGSVGARAIKAAGGTVLAQDERTSVVWGMPGAVVHAGLADAVVALEQLPEALQSLATGRRPSCPH